MIFQNLTVVRDATNYLCFTANTAGSTVAMATVGSPSFTPVLEYSTDGVLWQPFTIGSTTITLANVGDKVYFRGDNDGISESTSAYRNFVMTGSISASGSIMTLLDKTDTLRSLANCRDFCLYRLFFNCTSITTAPELPATTLVRGCYLQMFQDCTSITTAPELPATMLVDHCYASMFYNCTSLQVYTTSDTGHDKAWRIPTSGTGTTASSALSYMFYGTTGGVTTPTINTTYYTQNEPV